MCSPTRSGQSFHHLHAHQPPTMYTLSIFHSIFQLYLRKAKIGGEMEERKWDHQAPTQLLVPRAASSPGSLVWLRLVFVPFLGVAWFFTLSTLSTVFF